MNPSTHRSPLLHVRLYIGPADGGIGSGTTPPSVVSRLLPPAEYSSGESSSCHTEREVDGRNRRTTLQRNEGVASSLSLKNKLLGDDMSASPGCKPWCNDHLTDSEEDSCHTRFVIYDDGRPEKVPPAPGTKEAFVQAALPWEISRVAFEATQDEDDEKPLIGLHFFEAGDDPMESADLYMDLDELRTFHSNLTTILKELS